MAPRTRSSGKRTADIIKDEVRALASASGLPDDDEFIPGQQRIGPLFGSRKSEDELIIDEIFAGLDENKGFYLRLEKEVGPNDWQFKEKIDKYKHWTDAVFEISEYVRRKTRVEIERTGKAMQWGSGRYRISAHNINGIRDKKVAYEINVDAKEYEIEPPKFPQGIVPNTTPETDLVALVRQLQATQVGPNQIVEATQKGMELASSREGNAASSNATMMQAMMTMMTGMLTAMSQSNAQIIAAIAGKPTPTGPDPTQIMSNLTTMMERMGVVGKKEEPDILSQMVRFKELMGPTAKQEDGLSMLQNLGKVMNVVRELGGTTEGERPSLAETLVAQHGGKVVDLGIALLGLINKGQMPSVSPIIQQAQPVPQPMLIQPTPTPTQSAPTSITPTDNTIMEGEDPDMLAKLQKIKQFAEELNIYVYANDMTKYAYITEKIYENFGDQVDTKIRIGELTAKQLSDYVLQAETYVGMNHYPDADSKGKLYNYIHNYIQHLLTGLYLAKCPQCNTLKEYANLQAFLADAERICNYEGCTAKVQATI